MPNRTTIFASLGFLAPAAVAGEAAAQSAPRSLDGGSAGEFFGTPFGDGYSSVLLHELFGPLFPSAAGPTGATVFSSLVGYFNVFVLGIGGLLFLYNVFAGVLQTAHEGQILGRRWSSLWAPLRVLFAAALLMPAPGLGGYNAIQAGVAWLVKGSTAMASEVWSYGASQILSGSLPVTGTAPRFDGDIFKTVYRNQLCMRIANYQLEAAGSARRVSFDRISTGEFDEYVSAINGRLNGICGSYAIPKPPGYVSRLEGGAADAVASMFQSLHYDVLRFLIESANEALDAQWPAALGNGGEARDASGSIAGAISGAAEMLASGNRRILRAMLGADSGSGSARAAIMGFISGSNCDALVGGSICYGEGWIGAGNWYAVIARLNSEILGLVRASVSAQESDYINREINRLNRNIVVVADSPGWLGRNFLSLDAGKYMHIEEALRIWNFMNDELERSSAKLAASGFRLTARTVKDALPEERSGMLARIWQANFSEGLQAVIQTLSPVNWGGDPIVGLVAMGNWYLDVAGSLLLGGFATSLFAGSGASSTAILISAPLAAIGASQSFILPMLPFLFWIVAVAGYFLLVAESVVASTLWAFAHLRMDGEGISGDAGREGWMMLLGLVLTPTLMIFGFFAGMAIFRIASGLLDAGMFYAMSALLNASPIVGIFGLVAAGILIVVSYVVVIERSFSLVAEFPGRVLKWIGSDSRISDGPGQSRMGAGASGAATSIGSLAPRAGATLAGGGSMARRGLSKLMK
ncbi:MAG: DotA/TraY family protein [Albidovulum sp.]|nr:DotA/TraY family protein [Albidovulum sp.]